MAPVGLEPTDTLSDAHVKDAKLYVDVPAIPQKFYSLHSAYQFFAKLPTRKYTIFDRKALNFAQIGCFLQ